MHSLKENASDVNVFNKASLRAVGQEEAQLVNNCLENNQEGLIIVIISIISSV